MPDSSLPSRELSEIDRLRDLVRHAARRAEEMRGWMVAGMSDEIRRREFDRFTRDRDEYKAALSEPYPDDPPMVPDRIVIELTNGGVEATLWLNGCPLDGHSDSTGTLSMRSLVGPLIDRLETARIALALREARR